MSCLSPSLGVAPELFSSALQFFAAAQCLIREDWPRDANVFDNEEFDFIVVGAGTAGCVLANRLTENKDWNVLIIEAGGDPPVESIIPKLSGQMMNTEYDWQFLTRGDGRICEAVVDGSTSLGRGKMLGGCSSINALTYVRGNPHDFQEWYDQGNEDWHPDVVEKYFKKAESYQYLDQNDNDVLNTYGRNGPLVINVFNDTNDEVTKGVLSSWEEIGIKNVNDLNAAQSMGSGLMVATVGNGVRSSSATAYLIPIKSRKNLKILKNTHVTEILIDSSNKAYGVRAERIGKVYTLLARLEVIVSAGTVGSPQLLMLSGIGPKDHLESKHVASKVNSNMVGQNFQDHIWIPITIWTNISKPETEMDDYFNYIQYLYNRKGELAAKQTLTKVLSFYSSSDTLTYPEYQIHLSLVYKNSSDIDSIYKIKRRYKDPLTSNLTELNKHHTLLEFSFTLLHPVSKGNITLNTNDPKDKPVIYSNYLKDPRDLESSVVGIKIMSKIVNTEFLKSKSAFLGRLSWPPCDMFELDSEDYWRCVCIEMVSTLDHPVGTCKMGRHIETSVVDSHLRVHGVSNLRVIDASVMPTLTSGNTNGPVFMIAERGADLIKQDYNVTTQK